MLLESRGGSAQHAAPRFQRDQPAFISLHGWGSAGGRLLPPAPGQENSWLQKLGGWSKGPQSWGVI